MMFQGVLGRWVARRIWAESLDRVAYSRWFFQSSAETRQAVAGSSSRSWRRWA